MYDLIPRESDLVKSFVFGQGRIQIPSLACIFDENEDPQNEDTLLKQVQKRLALPLWKKIMFMRHTTKTRILTEILNSEFLHDFNLQRNISTAEPHGVFNGTTSKLK